jgi:tetratricopeptide (TPR) repeat protein
MRTPAFVLLFAALAIAGSQARADEPTTAPTTAAPDSPEARAADLFRRANKLYDAGKFAEAETLYREAWALSKSWDIACNLGAVELDLGKHRDAAEHLAYALREYPAGGKQTQRQALQERLQEARAHVGTLRVRVNVEGAEVSINGTSIGKTPLPPEVFVNPGAVAIDVRSDGYEPAKKTTEAKKGEAQDITITLTPKPRPSVAPAFVLGGLAIVGVGVGTGLMVASNDKANDAAKRLDQLVGTYGAKPCDNPAASSECTTTADTLRARDTLGNAAIGAFVGSGVAAAAGLGYWLITRREPTKTGRVQALPVVSSNAGGVVVLGSF